MYLQPCAVAKGMSHTYVDNAECSLPSVCDCHLAQFWSGLAAHCYTDLASV